MMRLSSPISRGEEMQGAQRLSNSKRKCVGINGAFKREKFKRKTKIWPWWYVSLLFIFSK